MRLGNKVSGYFLLVRAQANSGVLETGPPRIRNILGLRRELREALCNTGKYRSNHDKDGRTDDTKYLYGGDIAEDDEGEGNEAEGNEEEGSVNGYPSYFYLHPPLSLLEPLLS